jgi:hypothetical protein
MEGDMPAPDLRQLPRNDQLLLGAGVLAFIASFFPFYGISFDAGAFGSGSSSVTAWHSYGTLGVLLVIAAVILAAILVFSRTTLPDVPVSWNVILVGLAALGTLLIILRGFTYNTASAPGASIGLKWGAYVVMILCLAFTALAVMRLRSSGDSMPWQQTTAPPASPPTAG